MIRWRRHGRPWSGWFRRLKERLGYYELRRRRRRDPFRRDLRPGDAFLVGHPKSGNTWLAYMLAILLDGDAEGRVTTKNVGDFVPHIHARDYRIREFGELPDPRIFRNENPQYRELYPRIIYLVRDPRAALISLWHMYQVLFDDPVVTFDRFLDHYLSGAGIFKTWNSKLERWDVQVSAAFAEAETDPRILIVRYEDLVADREAVLRRLAIFLGIGESRDALARAVERGSFEAMRSVEDRHGAEAYEGRARREGKFMREGRTEGWREELEPAQVERIERELGDAMRLAGYELTADPSR